MGKVYDPRADPPQQEPLRVVVLVQRSMTTGLYLLGPGEHDLLACPGGLPKLGPEISFSVPAGVWIILGLITGWIAGAIVVLLIYHAVFGPRRTA